MSNERLDPQAARWDAMVNPREPGVPPHWARCEWMRDELRCRRGDGHAGKHWFTKEEMGTT
jgi:hypothetical protein